MVQITDTTKFGKFFSGDSYIVLNVRWTGRVSSASKKMLDTDGAPSHSLRGPLA